MKIQVLIVKNPANLIQKSNIFESVISKTWGNVPIEKNYEMMPKASSTCAYQMMESILSVLIISRIKITAKILLLRLLPSALAFKKIHNLLMIQAIKDFISMHIFYEIYPWLGIKITMKSETKQRSTIRINTHLPNIIFWYI